MNVIDYDKIIEKVKLAKSDLEFFHDNETVVFELLYYMADELLVDVCDQFTDEQLKMIKSKMVKMSFLSKIIIEK